MKIHFISGLPRSGSTLLAAILRQNPRFHAAMSGPLWGLFDSLVRNMGETNEYSMFISDAQRERIARSLFESFYAEMAGAKTLFDTSRGWCAQLPALAKLWPDAKVIACVRSPAWIVDSFERRAQQAPLRRGKVFPESAANVYARVDALMSQGGQLGPALQGFRQAWSGEQADRLIVVRYESLTENPAAVIGRLYEFVEEPPFVHDFEHLSYDEPEFDERLGMPGLHRVGEKVQPNRRTTILPADLFSQHDRSFWDVPGQNPRGVTVL